MPRAAFPSGRKSLFFLAVAAAIIGGAWWWQRPPPEPTHNGQRLSEWMAGVYDPNEGRYRIGEEIRAFGPGVLPWLAYTAGHGRHPLRRSEPLPFDEAPDWLRQRLPERWGGLRASPANDDRILALSALIELGPQAAPAIPVLVDLVEGKSGGEDDQVANFAAYALHRIGPASWPAVQQSLERGSPAARAMLLGLAYGRLGSLEKPASQAEAANTVAALVKACTDPNADVRSGAIGGIAGCYRERPDLIALDSAIQEVIRHLSDPDNWVRGIAARVLFQFGDKALSAIPRLIELLDDAETRVRGNAAESLGKLDGNAKRSAARLRVMALGDADPDCRKAAADALKTLGLSPEEKSAGQEALLAR